MKRRWIVPEVVQTSAMDCGPAALAALCTGVGLTASYGRLREACQTGVDGTSIDTIEDVANVLGLDAEQVMLPVDQLLDPESEALPAIVVTRQPNGFTHFVLAWRVHGPWVQVMDPAVGRRFVSRRQFLADCYVHAATVPAEVWLSVATAPTSLDLLRRRLRRLGAEDADRLVDDAQADGRWSAVAHLDAAARMAAAAIDGSGRRSRSSASAALLRRLFAAPEAVPDAWWPVVAADPGPDGEEQVLLRGAVLVRAIGRRAPGDEVTSLGPELDAARTEARPRPLRELVAALGEHDRRLLIGLAAGAVLAAAGVAIEALLLRALFDEVASGSLEASPPG